MVIVVIVDSGDWRVAHVGLEVAGEYMIGDEERLPVTHLRNSLAAPGLDCGG